MKNIQIIDGAENCVYDIYAATEEEFNLLFKEKTNIAFAEDISNLENPKALEEAFTKLWSRPVLKKNVQGIHGTIFYGLNEKKAYYPTLRDEEAINPDGSYLRINRVRFN